MYLGNIVSEDKLKENKLFNYSNGLNGLDENIPTLIIGWDFSKRLFNDKKLNILEKTISRNINWTFTKREKRIDFEKDLSFFIKNTIKTVEKNVKYYYVNILTLTYTKTKNIIKELISNKVCYIYVNRNSFVYIYTGDKIIGIDLNMIDFLNIDRKKVYKVLFSTGNKVTFSDDFLSKEMRENIENNKIIPYLYAITNDKERN